MAPLPRRRPTNHGHCDALGRIIRGPRKPLAFRAAQSADPPGRVAGTWSGTRSSIRRSVTRWVHAAARRTAWRHPIFQRASYSQR